MTSRRTIGRRMTKVVGALGVLAACGAILGGVMIARAIQSSRLHNTAAACERDNREHLLNIQFLQSLDVPAAVVAKARRVYVVIPDCEAYARQRIR